MKKKQNTCTKNQEEEKLKKEYNEIKEKYLRALADYQNLEKRVEDQIAQIKKNANKELFLKLLVILDDIENAQVFQNDEGLKQIKSKFIKLLNDEGVREIKLLGEQFNPEVAECVTVSDGEKDGIVTNVFSKGYMLFDKLLRPAKVCVSKKK